MDYDYMIPWLEMGRNFSWSESSLENPTDKDLDCCHEEQLQITDTAVQA